MSHFDELPEFTGEFKRLLKKYRTLEGDLARFERLLEQYPTGAGKNFTIVHSDKEVKVVKARMACLSLRDRSLRIIYAYHESIVTFVHIEIYYKGEKANEDRERIRDYLSRWGGKAVLIN